MPIGLGLNPQNSDVTSRYQPRIPQQPMMPVGNMFSQQSFQQPNITGLRNPYQSTAQDEAMYARKQAVANDPINRGLGVLANNTLDVMTPSKYLKAAGVPEDIAQVGDFVGPGEIKSLYALGSIGIKEFLEGMMKSQKDDIAKSLKNINTINNTSPIYSPPELLGSYRLGKIEEISNREIALQNIADIQKYAEVRSRVKPMTMAEMERLKAEETKLLVQLKQFETPEQLKVRNDYNSFKRDSSGVARAYNELGDNKISMQLLSNSPGYDRYLKGMVKYHYKGK